MEKLHYHDNGHVPAPPPRAVDFTPPFWRLTLEYKQPNQTPYPPDQDCPNNRVLQEALGQSARFTGGVA